MRRLLKGSFTHWARLAHTMVGIALAVALVSGTFVLTDTIRAAFARATTGTPGQVDLVVRSPARFNGTGDVSDQRDPLPASLLPAVQSVPGVKAAWGAVWGYAEIRDGAGRAVAANGLPAMGAAWTPDLPLAAGRVPAAPDEAAIDAATARSRGLHVGDGVEVLFEKTARRFTISGLSGKSRLVSSTLATFTLATAQQLLGQGDRLGALSVQAAPGVAVEELRARVVGALPAGSEVLTADRDAKDSRGAWTRSLGFLTTGLLVFAALALLVASFIICNTFSILVAQRTAELRLLRSVGASRRQLMSAVLAEAVLVGAVASAVGVVAGLVAARGLLSLMGAAGLTLPSASVVFRPRTAAAGMIAGVLVTAAAAIQPARRAARVTTLAATGGGHEPAGRRRRRLAVALAVTVVGVGELLTGLYGDPPRPLLAVAIGAALLLSGMSLLVPFLVAPAARLAGAPLVALFGEPARLGRQNAVRSPRRTAATASALMIGITLIGVVAILAASMKASARTAIESAMRSDFAITANSVPGSSGSVPPQVASRLRGVPQVAAVSEIRTGQWGLAGRTQTLVAVDPATVQRMYRLDAGSAAAAAALDDDGVLVRDSVAARQGWKVGDAVPMTFTRTGTRGLRLEGTYSTSTVRSDFVVSLHSFEANFAKQLDLEVDVLLAPGTASEGGRAAIRRALPDFPNLAVRNRSETLAAQEHEVDRVLVPVTALLVLSVVIALLGIANTLALAVHERVRELGLLRAVGMARSQLRTMIRSEAVITACTGAVLGVVVAAACGWIAASALASKGMTERVLPVGQLAALASVASLAGMAAAAMPARRAARMAVLDAVSAD